MSRDTPPRAPPKPAPEDAALTELLRASVATAHALWRAETDAARRRHLAAAATLVAHAAVDAMLQDAMRADVAHGERADPESTRPGTVLMRASRATAVRRRTLPPTVADLCQARRALGRNRTRADLARVDAWLDGDGAERALDAVTALHAALEAPIVD